MTDRGMHANQKRYLASSSILKFASSLLFVRNRKKNTLSSVELKRLEKRMQDFVVGGRALFLQRQGMYWAAALLGGYYYSWWIAIVCFVFCQTTELLDYAISQRVLNWKGGNATQAARFHSLLLLSSTLSAISVSLFAYLVARMEGPSAHFTPLLFLFAAGLFAAVNNHQIPKNPAGAFGNLRRGFPLYTHL